MPLAIAFGEAGVKPATRSFAGAKSKKKNLKLPQGCYHLFFKSIGACERVKRDVSI